MERIYFPNLNGLRFFAAFSVMIYHYFGKDIIDGRYGVTLFFVLSGFLITYLLLVEKNQSKTISIKKFYVRRLLRIWPLYFLIVLIGSVCFYQQNDDSLIGSGGLLYYLLFLPNLAFVLGKSLSFASILWSVGAEEQFYMIWPWFLRGIKGLRLLYFFIFVAIGWTILPYLLDFVNSNYLNTNVTLAVVSKVSTKMGFHAMAIGAVFAWLYYFESARIHFLYSAYVQFITIVVLLIFWIGGVFPEVMWVDSLFALLFGVLILNLATNPKVILSLEYSVLKFLGKISFGLYVYHLIAFSLIEYFYLPDVGVFKMLNFLLGIVLTVLISAVSYYWFEKPFIHLKNQRFSIIQSGSD